MEAVTPRSVRKRLALLLVFMFGLMVLPQVASAVTETPVGVDAQTDSAFNLDPFYVQVILGGIIPFLVAWVTTAATAPWVKKVIMIVLSAVTGLLTVGLTDDGGSVISGSSVKAAVQTVVLALTSYWVLVRNTKVEAALQAAGPNSDPPAG